MSINSGGAAFPNSDDHAAHAIGAAAMAGITDPIERDRAYIAARGAALQGMTLRDYFAVHAPVMATPALEVAEALAGRKLPEGFMDREIFWLDVDAEQRHLWAEAMLRARKGEA